jgi:hypothetical protein
MVNFEEIINDFGKVKSINGIVLLNTVNYLLMEYGSPILFFISASGSAVYIWLKIKREFYSKQKEEK